MFAAKFNHKTDDSFTRIEAIPHPRINGIGRQQANRPTWTKPGVIIVRQVFLTSEISNLKINLEKYPFRRNFA
jgi:hypothetical protein